MNSGTVISMPKKKAAKASQRANDRKEKATVKKIKLSDKNRKVKNTKGASWGRPEFIDEDVWPGAGAFSDSEKRIIGNLQVMRKAILRQIKKVELDIFKEDDDNEKEGKLTEQASPKKVQAGDKGIDDSTEKPAARVVDLFDAKKELKKEKEDTRTQDEKIADAAKEDDAERKAHLEAEKGGAKKEEEEDWTVPPLSVPVCTDVRNLDVEKLKDTMLKTRGQLFDVIMMDPPWQLATANPTRGVAIGYQQLADFHIKELPVRTLQTDGFIFIWVINAKYRFAIALLEFWGYKLVDEIVWVKQTVNRRLAKSHGFYLQHAKETCLVGFKGKLPKNTKPGVRSDVIWSVRRGQSQKPDEIYEYIESFVPNGHYLEIFARRNNLHDYWVSVGNEL